MKETESERKWNSLVQPTWSECWANCVKVDTSPTESKWLFARLFATTLNQKLWFDDRTHWNLFLDSAAFDVCSFVCSHLEHLWMLKLGYPLISRTKRSLETLSPNDSSRIILAAPFRRSSLWSAYFKRMFISVRWVKSCTSLCGYPKLSWRALIAFRVENAPKSLTNNPSRISTLSSLRTNSSGVDWSGPIEGRQLCSTKLFKLFKFFFFASNANRVSPRTLLNSWISSVHSNWLNKPSSRRTLSVNSDVKIDILLIAIRPIGQSESVR